MMRLAQVRGLIAATAAVILGILAVVEPARADEDAMPVVQVRMPRAEARIGNQEMILTYLPPTIATYTAPARLATITAYLQRYTDGTPTPGADVELTVDFIPGTLTEVAPGVYESHDWSLPAGRSDIEVAITVDGVTQTATVPFNVTSTSGPRPRAPIAVPVVSVPGYVFAVAGIAMYALVTFLFLLRRRNRAATRQAANAAPALHGVEGRAQDPALV